MTDRTTTLLHSIDPATSRGLEIGPLMTPVVTRDMGPVSYLDHADTDTLRAKYASHRDVDVDRIVEVDYVVGGRSLAEVVGPDGPFDYLIASHVLEHVPDPIAWLGEVREVLSPGGVLSLALPDKRRCFDVLRSPSVPADLVDAHLRRALAPTPRQIFDHYASAMAWNRTIAFPSEPPLDELTPVHSERYALDMARSALASGDYHDVHCWVFTPESFLRLARSLQQLGLFPFVIDRFTPTVGSEFFVSLRAVDPEPDPTARAAAIDAAHAESETAETGALRAANSELTARVGELEQERAQTYSSRSWQLTRPLRAVNRRLAALRGPDRTP